jgi:hypothetical protein
MKLYLKTGNFGVAWLFTLQSKIQSLSRTPIRDPKSKMCSLAPLSYGSLFFNPKSKIQNPKFAGLAPLCYPLKKESPDETISGNW